MQKTLKEQIAELRAAINAQESIREALGDEVTNTTLAALQERLAYLEAQIPVQDNRKTVTILFGDIVGFTSLVEKMDPDEILFMMNRLWDRLDAIIRQYGGFVDKHVGDKVMAIWGSESAREDDPDQAVRAALAIQSALTQGVVQLSLQMRMGIHTGPVMLGATGTTREYTAIGQAVNLADWLQEQSPAGGVLISAETHQLVHGLYEFLEMPVSLGKDSTGHQIAYLVGKIQPHIFRQQTRGIQGVETRMIGREREQAVIQEAFESVITNKSMVAITIAGDPGIGKSRLLYEFQHWLEKQEQPINLFKCRATERSMRAPYSLLRDIFANKIGIQDNDPLDVAREKLEQGILLIRPDDPNALEQAHFIGQLIGIDFSDSPHLSGILADPGQIRDRGLHQLGQVLAKTGARSPAVLMIEDLHWADDNSIEALLRVMKNSSDLPILIVTLTRPTLFERYPDWGLGIDHHTTLRINPLAEDQSRALVDEILQKTVSIPDGLKDLIVQDSDGNPFFLEELIKMLINDGVITTGKTWSIDESRLKDLRVPHTLQGIIQARLDSLPEKERLLLQCASIIGRTFWDKAVQKLTGMTAAENYEVLQSLVNRELIFIRASSSFAGAHEFIFKHNILREVTYGTVLKRQRKQYHHNAAEWIILTGGSRANEYATSIAEHFELSETFDEAARWHARAGKIAVDTYAPATALEHYALAFQYATQIHLPVTETLEWYHERGVALMAQAQFAEAEKNYRDLLSAAERCNDLILQAKAWNEISFIQDNDGKISDSMRSAQQAETLAQSAGEGGIEQLVKALINKGWIIYRQGDAHGAILFGNQALALVEERENYREAKRETAQVMQLLGAAYEIIGHYDRSTECEQNALDAFRAIGNRRGEAAMLNNQGVGAYVRGEYASAAIRYTEAIEAAKRIGSRDRVLIFTSNLGGAKIRLGNFASAENDLRWVIESLGTESTQYLPQTHAFLAEACLGLGKIEEALSMALKALNIAQDSRQMDLMAECWRTLGNCLAAANRQGDLSLTPRGCYEESARLFGSISLEAEKARTLDMWGRYETAQGHPGRGSELALEAKKTFEKLNIRS